MLPWQALQWQQLWQAHEAGQLPHALLLTGMAGIGKQLFAEQFIQAMCCQQPASQQACQTCHSCRLINHKTHPNVLFVSPEKVGQAIKIDQVRQINEFVNQSSLEGNYRFILIYPADNLNLNAANALLKTLEEPASGAIFILVCHQLSRLPATIRSRCQKLFFTCPSIKQGMQWLQSQVLQTDIPLDLLLRIVNGAPLAALAWIKENKWQTRKTLYQALLLLQQKKANPLKLATHWQEDDPLFFLDLFWSFVTDLLKLHFILKEAPIMNQDYKETLLAVKTIISPAACLQFMKYLQQLRIELYKSINLNKQLLIESLLIGWMECANVS